MNNFGNWDKIFKKEEFFFSYIYLFFGHLITISQLYNVCCENSNFNSGKKADSLKPIKCLICEIGIETRAAVMKVSKYL